MTEERIKWWRYAMMRFGRDPCERKSSFAQQDLDALAEDIQAMKDETSTPAETASKESTAKSNYVGLNYSRWEAWTPDDPATKEEAAAAAETKRKAEDSAFEAANPDFCGQFLSDMRKRREKETQKLEDSQRLRLKGNEAFKRKHLERALTLYFECLSLTPFDAAVLTNLAAVHSALGQFEVATEFADRALYISPANLKALFRRGAALGKCNKLTEAKADLESAAKLPGANAQVRYALLDATGALVERAAAASAAAALAAQPCEDVPRNADLESRAAQSTAAVVTVPIPSSPRHCLSAVAALASWVIAALPTQGATKATVQAVQLLERAARSGQVDHRGLAAVLHAPLAWARGSAATVSSTAKSDSVIVSNIMAQSGALHAVCCFLTASAASTVGQMDAELLVAGAYLVGSAAQRSSAAAAVVRDADVATKLCAALVPVASKAAAAARSGFQAEAARMAGAGRGSETAQAAVGGAVESLQQFQQALTLGNSQSVPSATVVGAVLDLLLALFRLARPEHPGGVADDRFLRTATKDRTFIHRSLPSFTMWSVGALAASPPPGLVATAASAQGGAGGLPITASQAKRQEGRILQLLDACASLTQFLALHSNTASTPDAVTDGAAEEWGGLALGVVSGAQPGVLSPVLSMLQALACIIPRAVWDAELLVSPASQAATAALANLAHHPHMRAHFAAELPLAPPSAADAANSGMALRPLLDLVRLPLGTSETWERVCAQALGAITNAATQCPQVAQAAHKAGAVGLLVSGICNTLGVTPPAVPDAAAQLGAGAEAPLPPLVLLRAAMCLGRLRAMDTSGAIVAGLRTLKMCACLAQCCDALCCRLAFCKGELAVVDADAASCAAALDALVLLLTAVSTATASEDRLQTAARQSALVCIVKHGGLRSSVAWMVHSVSSAKTAAQRSLAGTVVSGGQAVGDAALAQVHVPPSAMRKFLGTRLRACGNISKLVTNCAGAAATGTPGVVADDVFDAVLFAGGVEALVEVVKADEDKGPVRQNASIALARLAKNPACAQRLRDCGGMKVLMQLHSELGRK